ncbi:MAG: efflux RND transporter periplasmic adaptor subunit [Thermoanaerobaculia bacterium]
MNRRVALFVGCLALLPLVLLASCSRGNEARAPELWTCPMHPGYVSDHPGSCPICNMDLVRKDAARAPVNSAAAAATAGTSEVVLSDAGAQLAGVQTEAARVGHLKRKTRASGSVVADERRRVRAQSKISGWVEKLAVGATGQYVHKGEAAMAIYSPALLSAQSEYLLARDAANRFAGSELPEVRRGGQDLLVAARRRLELLDVPESFIVELDRTRTVQRTVDLIVPATGFVTEKAVTLGQEIVPGMDLYTVTDLSRVWVEAAFYESDARLLAVGRAAEIHLPFDPGKSVSAKISYIYPTVDAQARTLTARFELANPGFSLRPGMFVDVELETDLGEAVLVPETAVLDSGLSKVVFVETAPGRFERRTVDVGERSDGAIQIVRGIAAGDKVATKANFLLDAESRLGRDSATGPR